VPQTKNNITFGTDINIHLQQVLAANATPYNFPPTSTSVAPNKFPLSSNITTELAVNGTSMIRMKMSILRF
jgi:hypothetical protein